MERKTVQRDVLLNVIGKAGHITIKDILENAKSCFPSMSIGTIYRNLSVLENEGLIRRIPTIYKEDVYETTDYPVHDHFICKDCHTIIDLERKDSFKPYLNKYGDNVEEKITVYYGTCVDCLNKKKC
ncbi:MAG: transcriptional repressor [Methanobrevibacter boviskoreani]|uniref:Fur family transcriptional regulator n=1 Tax=Methanobrevibacter boviskoreani TaxID=1348249 RepID=UPI0023A79E71|nr:transcriptional repressor [Methanobrevibacter boviskoreani]MCI6930817.1 transcriptional repressor [Methanobrevibacter boviskoreani]MDY2724006.1 transcriptional repressor [Candidatus Onthovivens sp.]